MLPKEPKPLVTHPSLRSLPRDLRPQIVEWLEQLVALYPKPEVENVLQDMDDLLFGQGVAIDPRILGKLQDWYSALTEGELNALVQAAFQKKSGKQEHPKATPEQVSIILDAQREVGLDFTRFLDQFTSWEADAIIKAVVLLSEIQRQTGDRHFPLREVRLAVRQYIQTRG